MGRDSDRERVLKELVSSLGPVLEMLEYKYRPREELYRRSSGDVSAEVRLGVSSKPAYLHYHGVLVEPMLVVRVPAWEAELARRLSTQRTALRFSEMPTPVLLTPLFDVTPWITARWTLPDNPDTDELKAAATSVQEAVEKVAVPMLERLSRPEAILSALASGDLRPLADARPTLACGALLAGKPELAKLALTTFGSARRAEIESLLGPRGTDDEMGNHVTSHE